MKKPSIIKFLLLIGLLTQFGNLFAQELLVPKLKVLYWTGGTLDSLIYQPCEEGRDAFVCVNDGPPGGFCDTINYGNACNLQLKEDWCWTRRVFIQFDTIVTAYDSLENAQLWLYKYGVSSHANWIQAYLVTGPWDEFIIEYVTEPTVDMTVFSDQFTPPFPAWEGWVVLNIDTIYQRWVAGPNYGLYLRQQDLDSDAGQNFYSSENCSPVDPAFVFPPESCFTSCADQEIIARFDYYCVQVDSSRLTMTVDGTIYPMTAPEISLHRSPNSDTLFFNPSTPFSDGDTILAILNEIYTDMGIWSPESPLSHTFFVDLAGPELVFSTISPGATVSGSEDSFCIDIVDEMAGTDTTTIDIQLNGSSIGFTTTVFGDTLRLCASLSSLNDSNTICLHAEDLAVLCGANVTDTCWFFYRVQGIIDSVWFFEETECNDSNWVTICYNLSGDTVNTIRRLSADSGVTWAVVAPTVRDTLGNLGYGIIPGEHCFDWLLSVDAPSTEDDDWIVEIGIDSTTGPAYAMIDSFWTASLPGPVDSRGPTVTLSPIAPRYSIGEIIDFSWFADDMFLGASDAVIAFFHDAGVDSFATTDTTFSWTAPPSCDTILMTLAVRDSFCNWGFDSTVFLVCPVFDVIVDCSPCDAFSSYSTLTVSYILADTLCSSTPNSVFFSAEVFHPLGGSDFYSMIGPSVDISITEIVGTGWNLLIGNIPFSDGDSVSISLDSLFDLNGCKTEP